MFPNLFRQWIHHLLDPHCPHCLETAREKSICPNCEVLRQQLEIANYEKRQLTDTIVAMVLPKVADIPIVQSEQKPIRPRTIPWRVKQQELEANSRDLARIQREQAELAKQAGLKSSITTPEISIEDLEKELQIVETKRESEFEVLKETGNG